MEHRKTLSLKKPVDSEKEKLKAEKIAATKAKQALISRLNVHKNATKLLKDAKHPMRIMQLTRMLARLNRIFLTTNKIVVKYVDEKQVYENLI